MTSTMQGALRELLSDLDATIAQENPRCDVSGRCCRFTEFGHTLFLTAPEAELLFSEGIPNGSILSRHTCPFQMQGRCTARERRPMGCRVFFCDPAYQNRQAEIAEQFVGRLKEIHRRLDAAWDYRPLHRFLEELGPLDDSPTAPGSLVELT